jgi:hypothetical protein
MYFHTVQKSELSKIENVFDYEYYEYLFYYLCINDITWNAFGIALTNSISTGSISPVWIYLNE